MISQKGVMQMGNKIWKYCVLIGVVFFFVQFAGSTVWAGKHSIEFDRKGFSLQLPEKWVKVPRDVFRKKMQELKQAYEQAEADEEIPYDYAIQLESKDWFEYPYMLITLWEDERVDRDEMREMNQKVKKNLLREGKGVNSTKLVHSNFDAEDFLYRIESRFKLADRQMVLFKAVQYMNNGVLEIATYMPENMYSQYAPEVKDAIDSLHLSPGNVHHKNPVKSLDFKKDVLPYLNVIIAAFLVIILIGIFVWKSKRDPNK